ncbi:sugar phosphate nucleotidyltransferase [beta proteobacterium MWH-UniP1]
MNSIVLCGGLGTRLGGLTRTTPKPLLEVAGKPFISHVLEKLRAAGVTYVCLAVGFQWEKIRAALGDSWAGLSLSYSVESKPLGTGGAVRKALQSMCWSEAFVVNGDTLVDVELLAMRNLALSRDADLVIALKNVEETARYGRVNLLQSSRIASFSEKGLSDPGLINAGLYWLKAEALNCFQGEVFSLERDIMASHVHDLSIYGFVTPGYFIDMGIPEDLERARRELSDRASNLHDRS